MSPWIPPTPGNNIARGFLVGLPLLLGGVLAMVSHFPDPRWMLSGGVAAIIGFELLAAVRRAWTRD